jgi:hypothetical protein
MPRRAASRSRVRLAAAGVGVEQGVDPVVAERREGIFVCTHPDPG